MSVLLDLGGGGAITLSALIRGIRILRQFERGTNVLTIGLGREFALTLVLYQSSLTYY